MVLSVTIANGGGAQSLYCGSAAILETIANANDCKCVYLVYTWRFPEVSTEFPSKAQEISLQQIGFRYHLRLLHFWHMPGTA